MNSLFRVNMLKGGRWQMWTNYASYEDAELAACGLIQGGKASQCHILEIRADGGRIIALVESTPKVGFPPGQAVVKKIPHTTTN